MIENVALTAFFAGGHVAFYGGGFLPIATTTIQLEKSQAISVFKKWSLLFIAGVFLIGLSCYSFQQTIFFPWIPLIINLTLVAFGVITLLQKSVSNKTLSELVSTKNFISLLGLLQSVTILQAIDATSAVTPNITISEALAITFCFAFSVLIHVAIISFMLWIIAATGRSSWLRRWLAAMFAVICIVIGILNLL